MAKTGILASFDHQDSTVEAIEALRGAGVRGVMAYTPYPDHDIEHALGYGQSPVRIWTLVGGLTGTATGFAFTSFTSMDWPLVTGGKPILAIPAYVTIAFELTILFGALSTVIGLFINSRLPNLKPIVIYDPEFSAGRYGVFVEVDDQEVQKVKALLEPCEPAELRESREGSHV